MNYWAVFFRGFKPCTMVVQKMFLTLRQMQSGTFPVGVGEIFV